MFTKTLFHRTALSAWWVVAFKHPERVLKDAP